MKVAIIGAGSMGKALAKRLSLAGHEIRLSFSRDEEELRATAARLGVGFGVPDEVSKWADVIALATPWPALETVMDALGDLSGKIVWDNTNAGASDLSTMLVRHHDFGRRGGSKARAGSACRQMHSDLRRVARRRRPATQWCSGDELCCGQ